MIPLGIILVLYKLNFIGGLCQRLYMYIIYTRSANRLKFCNEFEKKRLQGNGRDGRRTMTVGDASRQVGESIKSKM